FIWLFHGKRGFRRGFYSVLYRPQALRPVGGRPGSLAFDARSDTIDRVKKGRSSEKLLASLAHDLVRRPSSAVSRCSLAMTMLMQLYVGAGLLLIVLSLPLLFQKVPPNPLYGFRLSPALDDPKIWYATNTHSAKRLMAAGASSVAAAIALYFI